MWFLQIGSKQHLEVIWNAIPIGFLQTRLSLDALAHLNQISKCLLRHSQCNTQRRCQIHSDGSAMYTSLCRWVCLVRRRVLHRNLTAGLFGGRDDGSAFLMLWSWRAASPAYVVTDAYIVTTATCADRSVMAGHTNPIWSLANDSEEDLRNKFDLPAVWTKPWTA